MSIFKIDFFELLFLAEVCIPPRPIARTMFWDRLCDELYLKMRPSEREQMYDAIRDRLDMNNEGCQLFEARFNPQNQYLVDTRFEEIVRTLECFKYKGQYHTSKATSIIPEYIVSVKPNFQTNEEVRNIS